MTTKYSISKERDGFAVCIRKSGVILVTFPNRWDADEYIVHQLRADEQSRVMSAYNEAEEIRCLAAESAAEFGWSV